jgi:hypothetical protein
MTHCSACHRPLRLPSPDGLGPVCRRNRAAPASAADLFGFRPEVFAQEVGDKLLAALRQEIAALTRRRMEALA